MWHQIAQIAAPLLGEAAGKAVGNTSVGKAMGGAEAFKGAAQELPTLFGTGKAQGEQMRKYLGAAYPSISENNRAASVGGAAGAHSSAVSAHTQERMQKRELSTRTKIAKMNARAQIAASMGQFGKPGIQAGLNIVRDREFDDFDNQLRVQRDRLPSELRKLTADTQNAIASSVLKVRQAETEGHRSEIEREAAKLSRMIAIARAYRGDGDFLTGARLEELAKGKLPPGTAASATAIYKMIVGGLPGRGTLRNLSNWWRGTKPTRPSGRMTTPGAALRRDESIKLQHRRSTQPPPMRPGGLRERMMHQASP